MLINFYKKSNDTYMNDHLRVLFNRFILKIPRFGVLVVFKQEG